MKAETAQRLLTRLLLGFVLISIGFALGKEFARRSTASGSASNAAESGKTTVYYMHATIRCVTCNRIEAMARQIVDTRFADALKSGRLKWVEVNYQANEALARKYNVTASTVVVVGPSGEFENLSKVWDLYDKSDQFNAYVGDAIAKHLEAK